MKKKTTTFYKKFLGSLTKQGKKVAAKRILQHSLVKASTKTKRSIYVILVEISSLLNSWVEIKKVRLRRNVYNVPYPLTSRRQQFLKIKWILDEVKKDKKRVKTSEKLSAQMIDLLINKKSKILLRKNYVQRDVLANQANMHYRW